MSNDNQRDFPEDWRAAVRDSLPVDPDDDTIVIGYDESGIPQWGSPERLVTAVLAELAKTGALTGITAVEVAG